MIKRLFSIAAHLPHLDPRIDWSAKTASQYFEVTVVGIWTYGTPHKMNTPYND